MANEFKIEGIEDLTSRLYALGEKIANRAANKALREGAEVLRQGISKRAPRSKSNTDHIADNIVKSSVRTSKHGVKHIIVGPDKKHFYGKFLEFGMRSAA